MALTLKNQKSVLNNLSCKETIHKDKLELLINSNLLQTEGKDGRDYNEKQQLIKYKKQVESKITYVKYGYYGRVFCKNSIGLQQMRRELRHTLAKDLYVDIDIINAHPTILSQVLHMNEIDHNSLNKYVNNRDKYINRVMNTYEVNRENSKDLFIRLLYGGSFNNWIKYNNIQNDKQLTFLQDLTNEIKFITTLIETNNPNIKKQLEKKKGIENVKCNSVISIYLQELENRILEVIFNYCVNNNYIINNNCVLCFDGLMIPKENYKDGLLDELNEEIKEKLNFDLKFSIKNFDEGYTDEELEDTQIEYEKTKYEIIKEEFEKTNFKINDVDSYASILTDGNLKLRSRFKIIERYENLHYKEVKETKNGLKEVDISFTKEWFKDENIKTYDNITFLPMEKTDDRIYNMFHGYRAGKIPLKKTDIENSKMWFHMKAVLSNHNEEFFNYFVKWLARILQDPTGGKNRTAVCLRSEFEGSGKDTVLLWFGKYIIGEDYYYNDENTDCIFGRFNYVRQNKILITLNESKGKNNYKLVEQIKNNITCDKIKIEHKGFDAFQIKNTTFFCFLTNNSNPLKIPHKERRFFCNQCSDEYEENTEYFDALYSEMRNDEYTRAFYDYLMELDISTFDFKNSRPITPYYEDMREMNTPIMALFLEHVILTVHRPDNLYKVMSNELFNNFKEFLTMCNVKYDVTLTKFGVDIKNYKGVKRDRVSKGTELYLNYIELKEYLFSKYQIKFVEEEYNFIEDN